MNNNNSQSIEARLSGDKVGSLVARYSIPGAIAFVFFSIQSIVDGIIVGNFLGPDALANISLILPVSVSNRRKHRPYVFRYLMAICR